MLYDRQERARLVAIKEKGCDSDEMARLEKANMSFEASLIIQYKNRGLTFDGLIEVSKASLRNGAESYDLSSDNKFIPHAVTQMRHAIEQSLAQEKAWKLFLTKAPQ